MKKIKIIHIVNKITSTSFAVELADRLNDNPKIISRIISLEEYEDETDLSNSAILDTHSPMDGFINTIREIERMDFDIIHTHQNRSAAGVGVANSVLDTELIHFNTQHGHIHYSFLQKVINLLPIQLADVVVFNSETTKESYNIMERMFLSNSAEHVIYNGIQNDKIEPYSATIEEVSTIITAARLIKRKNIANVIKCLNISDDIQLVIVGDGPEKNNLISLVNSLNLKERVEFTGFLPTREDVYEQMASADAFVLPSHNEGFGVSVVEAMGVGLPVIVSDIPIFHEVLGENGIFIDRTDPRQIYKGIKKLIESPSKAAKLGKRNRKRALNKFSMENTITKYTEAYENALKIQTT